MTSSRIPIGQMLLRAGRIDPWQLQSGLAHQRRWGGRLGGVLVGLGFVSEQAVLTEVARQLGVEYVELAGRSVPMEVLRLVPEKIVRARKALPIALASESRRGPLVVAMAEPQNLATLDEIAFVSGLAVRPALASERDLDRAIARHLDGIDALALAEPDGPGDAVPLADDESVPLDLVPIAV